MHTAIALIFRNLLSFRTQNRLPAGRRQRLAADLARLAASPPPSWSFTLPPAVGLASALVDLFRLYAAVRFFYTGEKTRLHLSGTTLPPAGVPWLEVAGGGEDGQTIAVNADGSLAAFLPELPPGMACTWRQRQYYLTRPLTAWLVRRLWNFPRLREGQFEIMSRLAEGRNTLAILPTGAGKSLCFQVPALLLPGITLVVSPLKSLMRDQYVNLRKAGVRGVEFLDSSKSAAEKNEVLAKLRSGGLKLLYISPERLQIQAFQQELAEAMAACPVSLFVVDEAHCISEWGHDFRPSYLRLRHFITRLDQPPVCALTATASRYVRQDILNLLGLNEQELVTPVTMDRRELSLQVKVLDREDDCHQAISEALNREIPAALGHPLEAIHRRGAGIIFTPYAAPRGRHTRPWGAEAVQEMLRRQGLDCRYYHAQMPDAERIAVQDLFKDNAFPLLVATKGYGMGIDKENIDYIIHACAPASLEAYYQEAGRAGRDGQHAHSLILARPRLDKCVEAEPGLPSCHQGWMCLYTGGAKCDYGIQAGLLAVEYPTEQETARRFTRFLAQLESHAGGREVFRYICPARDSARHQKYLYYLQVLGAVQEFTVLEYRRVGENSFDLLVQVELAGPDSLDNKYWLANQVVERIEMYKAQKLNMLNTVQLYIKAKTCRRRFLMQYFGDPVAYDRCDFCDVDGISARAAPAGVPAAQEILVLLQDALTEHSLLLAMEVIRQAEHLDARDDIAVRAMRELEDRPHNPAALYLAGICAAANPDTEAYGMRNLMGAAEYCLEEEPGLGPALFAQLARENPPAAYAVARQFLARLDTDTLRELAAVLSAPDQYPDIHLALLLPQLQRINRILYTEVPGNAQQ